MAGRRKSPLSWSTCWFNQSCKLYSYLTSHCLKLTLLRCAKADLKCSRNSPGVKRELYGYKKCTIITDQFVSVTDQHTVNVLDHSQSVRSLINNLKNEENKRHSKMLNIQQRTTGKGDLTHISPSHPPLSPYPNLNLQTAANAIIPDNWLLHKNVTMFLTKDPLIELSILLLQPLEERISVSRDVHYYEFCDLIGQNRVLTHLDPRRFTKCSRLFIFREYM